MAVEKKKIGAGLGDAMVGQLALFAMYYTPWNWIACDGKLLPIATNQMLFSLLGTAFGGDGKETFALPDLRTLVPIHDPTHRGTPKQDPQIPAPTALAMKLSADHLPPHFHTATFDGADATAVASVPLKVRLKTGNGLPQEGGFLGQGGSKAAIAPIYLQKGQESSTKFMLNGGEASVTIASEGSVTVAPSAPTSQFLVLPHVKMMWCICLVGLFPQRP